MSDLPAATVIDTYALQIIQTDFNRRWEGWSLEALMREAEENLTLLLPAGFSCRITRWNEETTDE